MTGSASWTRCPSCGCIAGPYATSSGNTRFNTIAKNAAGRSRRLSVSQPPPPLIIARNSRRVLALSRKAPSMRLVTMLTPSRWTPRVVMQ